jgi:hypothetical protein
MQYSHQARFVAGKTFFQNEKKWIDSAIQKSSNVKTVRIHFASQDYFDFLARHPQAAPWLALGEDVQVFLDDTIYEIYG